jgi:hypothetical protein
LLGRERIPWRSDDLKSHLSCSQGSGLALVIIAGRHLDDIRADNVQLLNSAQDADELAGRPVLDPATAPGTGTPEPGGWTTREFIRILRGIEKLNPDRCAR